MGCSLEHAVNCPAREAPHLSYLHVLLDQANTPRRLVVADNDSGVRSSAYPCSTLLGEMRRWVLRDRLSLPLPRVENQSRRWGACFTRAPRGEEFHLYSLQVIKDLFGLSPSSLALRHFEGTDHSTARHR